MQRCLNADSGNPKAMNHAPACRARFLKIFEENEPDELVKMAEKFLKEREGSEEVVKMIQTANSKEELSGIGDDEDMGADHDTATSSGENRTQQETELNWNIITGEEAPNMDISSVVYAVTASEQLTEKVEESAKTPKEWEDDVKRMNQALSEEGFENSIIEVYSPKELME